MDPEDLPQWHVIRSTPTAGGLPDPVGITDTLSSAIDLVERDCDAPVAEVDGECLCGAEVPGSAGRAIGRVAEDGGWGRLVAALVTSDLCGTCRATLSDTRYALVRVVAGRRVEQLEVAPAA